MLMEQKGYIILCLDEHHRINTLNNMNCKSDSQLFSYWPCHIGFKFELCETVCQ